MSTLPVITDLITAGAYADQLNAYVGLVISQCPDVSIAAELVSIQSRLYNIVSHLTNPRVNGLGNPIPRTTFDPAYVTLVQGWTSVRKALLTPPNIYALPGGNISVAGLFMAGRMAKRVAVQCTPLALADSIDTSVVQYLYAVSDHLFVDGRTVGVQAGDVDQTGDLVV